MKIEIDLNSECDKLYALLADCINSSGLPAYAVVGVLEVLKADVIQQNQEEPDDSESARD